MSDRSKGVLFFARFQPFGTWSNTTTVATFPSTLLEVSEANLRQISVTTGSSATPPLGFRWETAEVGNGCNSVTVLQCYDEADEHGKKAWKLPMKERETLRYMWEMSMCFLNMLVSMPFFFGIYYKTIGYTYRLYVL